MVNPQRGEVGLEVCGARYRLCLTLGALAEIEAALGVDRLCDLEARFRALKARDVVAILAALLRGGGHPLTEEEVATWPLRLSEATAAIGRALAAAGLSADD